MDNMKNDNDHLTQSCSQAVANLLETDNPQLVSLGMDGFDIYDYFVCDLD